MKPFESTAADDGNVTPSSEEESYEVLPTVEQFNCSPCDRVCDLRRRAQSPVRHVNSEQKLLDVMRRDLL